MRWVRVLLHSHSMLGNVRIAYSCRPNLHSESFAGVNGNIQVSGGKGQANGQCLADSLLFMLWASCLGLL
jgi:hypothetical protein